MSDDRSAGVYDATLKLIMGAISSQVVRTLAGLSVAEHLDAGPLTAEAIARRESVDPAMTFRVLQAATALDLVAYTPSDRSFATTPALRLLHQDSPDCLKHYAMHVAGPSVYLPALRLPHAVTDGRPQSVDAVGSSHFDYLSDNPDAGALFSAAMSDISTPLIRAAVPLIDVTGARYAIDLGGAQGVFITELLRANPDLRGAVFDQPHVIDDVRAGLLAQDLGSRVDCVAGDFFEAVPSADVYLLKFILHDWDDAACTKILSNVRRSMNSGARLLIFELMLDDAAPDVYATLLDLVMMSVLGGRERTLADYHSLLDSAGLARADLIDIRSGYRVLVATAA